MSSVLPLSSKISPPFLHKLQFLSNFTSSVSLPSGPFSKSRICFSIPPSSNSNNSQEEARWFREEQRWLREEQRWMREESCWNAERERLLQEINSLQLRIQELERLNSRQSASVSETVANIAELLQGCDASVLLDDTANFVGEKTAAPNLNSLRGFEVIDAIKADLEYVCPQIVSCADILAVAARDSVVLSGGPGWEVQLGRKDSLSASKTAANNNIPGPNSDVPTLASKFQNVGLSLEDMVALSGAHTMGKARCSTFSSRINGNNNANSPDINLEFLQSLQQLCSQSNSNTTLADLDHMTPSMFDNQYYTNILSGEGLLASDQALATGNDGTREIIETYVDDPSAFYEDFKNSMLKMGSLVTVSSGGEIRRNCRVIN